MDRFQQMSVFVAVAETQSFAAAARRLRMSAPAVTRAVSALEAQLGVQLLTRTTRVVRVTDIGERYLADARRILNDLEEAEAAAAGINATPRGQLSITAPVLFGKLYVMPILAEYQTTYPQTEVHALFVDRVVNLVDEGMDVGIRIGELPDSTVRAIGVGRVRRIVVAAPAYLEQHGVPATPEDLPAHRLVVPGGIWSTSEWTFEPNGQRQTVRVRPGIITNTNDGALEAARLGYGMTRLLSYQVAPQLATGELVRVLADFEGPDLPVHVIHREGRHGSAKVRSFVDMAIERLRGAEALGWGAAGR
ncbi:MAG: LysR family transcriptional regulator [Gammaproteobacteria bacterium]|nr:LysR family transcriptional regulator [Gammaproteobacteria bacterium]